MAELYSLLEILTEVDDMYEASSTFTQDQKIRWVNKEIRELWKEMALDDILVIPTREKNAIYELPANIELEMIRSLVLDGYEYKFRDDNQGLPWRSYYRYLDGQQGEVSYIGLYPVPAKDNLDITIAYWARPVDLTTADLNTVPKVRQDYLEAVIYGVIARMAKIRQDVELANNYTADKPFRS